MDYSYDGNVSFPLKFVKSGLDYSLKNSCSFENFVWNTCVEICLFTVVINECGLKIQDANGVIKNQKSKNSCYVRKKKDKRRANDLKDIT